MIRSSSFTSGQPPANKPFSFGSGGGTGGSTSNDGGFSFGRTNTNTSTGTGTTTGGAAGGFSFGSTSTAQQQPAATSTTGGGGFSFGAPSTTQQPQQQPATGGGLFSGFGASTSNQQNKPATTGGFSFGQSASTNTAGTSTTGGGLFGGGASTNTGSLFGTGNAQPATTSGNAGGLFGGGSSLFGASQAQPQLQQQQPTSALLSHPYYQKERFNDLSDDPRKLLEEFQKHITTQTNLRDELTAKLVPSSSSTSNLSILGQQISSLYSDLKYANMSLATVSSSLESELANVRRLAEAVETDRQDFANLWEIGNAFRERHQAAASNAAPPGQNTNNPQGGTAVDSSASLSASTPGGLEVRRDFLINYLGKQASDFQSKILRYRSTISQIERHLSSLSSRDSHSPQAISDVIHFQHSTFMNLANQVAALHSEVDVLKRDYRQWYAKAFRSARDPFEMSDLAGNL